MAATEVPDPRNANEAGYSLSYVTGAVYSLLHTKEAGYSLSEVPRAGCLLSSANEAGCPLSSANEAAHSLLYTKEAGCSLSEPPEAAYLLSNANEAGYSLSYANEAVDSLLSPKGAGHSLSEMPVGGCSGSRLRSPSFGPMTKANRVLPEALDSLRRAAAANVQAFDAQGLAHTLWTSTKTSWVLPEISNAVCRAAAGNGQAFNALGLASTLWARASRVWLRGGSKHPKRVISRPRLLAAYRCGFDIEMAPVLCGTPGNWRSWREATTLTTILDHLLTGNALGSIMTLLGRLHAVTDVATNEGTSWAIAQLHEIGSSDTVALLTDRSRANQAQDPRELLRTQGYIRGSGMPAVA